LGLFEGSDVLRSTHKGLPIYFDVRASVLTQPTPTLPPCCRPARTSPGGVAGTILNDLALSGEKILT